MEDGGAASRGHSTFEHLAIACHDENGRIEKGLHGEYRGLVVSFGFEGDSSPCCTSSLQDAPLGRPRPRRSVAVPRGSTQTLRVPPFAAVRHGEGPFEAGKRLGTDAVVTGTIQKTRDRLHVSVELSRVDESAQFWSWTFDALPGEILKVEHEIAERVAARLGAKLMDDGGRLVRRETVSGEAYDLFLQAREQWKLRNPASVRTAIGLYEKAIQIDPDFARAYAGLADCYNITMSGIPAKVRYTLAKANAEKAIALDPESAEGHTSLAFMRYKLEWRWRDADAEFKRAIALDPRYQLAHHWYGEFLRLMGKTEEGITELKIALDLAPESLAARTDLIAAVVQGKHLAEARALLDAGLKIDPNWGAFNVWMSEILAREGREKESVENLWRWMSLRGVPMSEVDELRAGYAKGRMQGMLRAQVQQYLRQEVKPTSSASFEIATFLSFTYARLGDREEAFHWLDIAIDRHQDAAIHLLTNPSYDSIRSNPRFDQLLTRLDLKGY